VGQAQARIVLHGLCSTVFEPKQGKNQQTTLQIRDSCKDTGALLTEILYLLPYLLIMAVLYVSRRKGIMFYRCIFSFLVFQRVISEVTPTPQKNPPKTLKWAFQPCKISVN